MRIAALCTCLSVASAALCVQAHAEDEVVSALEYRFTSKGVIDDLHDNLAASVKLYPYVAIESAECLLPGRDKDKPKEPKDKDPSRLVLLCGAQQSIFQRVAAAYWKTLTMHSVNDLSMSVQSTTIDCSVKKCWGPGHGAGAVPCLPQVINPYGLVCSHNGSINPLHICQ